MAAIRPYLVVSFHYAHTVKSNSVTINFLESVMYSAFTLANQIENPVGLKTAASYVSSAKGLHSNVNITDEAAALLLKPGVCASDATVMARFWRNDSVCVLLAKQEKRASVLLTLLESEKAVDVVLNKFVTIPQLRKSKTLTSYVIRNYLDQLPIDVTDSWFETVSFSQKIMLASRSGSNISNETLLASLTAPAAVKDTTMGDKIIAQFFDVRPDVVIPLVKHNSRFFKPALWSTADTGLLGNITTALLNSVENKLPSTAHSFNALTETYALAVLLREHPFVGRRIRKYVISRLTEILENAPVGANRSVIKTLSHFKDTALDTQPLVYSDPLVRYASTSLILRFVETYAPKLTPMTSRGLTDNFSSYHGFYMRNVTGQAVDVLQALQSTQTDERKLSLTEALADIDSVGYETFCRSKKFVYRPQSFSASYSDEERFSHGRNIAMATRMNSSDRRDYLSQQAVCNVGYYVDQVLADNESRWRTLWEVADTFTGTVEELLILTESLNS